MTKINNITARLINRQYGKYYEKSYDNALVRLMVRPWDNWRGINPSGIGADFNPDPPIFAAKFANTENYNHILAVANEDGRIALQNTFVKNSTSEDLSLEGDQCHYNAVFDIAWMPYHLKLISASGDHTARLWDVTESKLINIREFCGHSRSVKVAAFRKNDCSVFSTGGRDGAILIWDLRSNTNNEVQKIDNRIYNAHIGGGPTTPSTRRRGNRYATPKNQTNVSNSSVTGLIFQNENTLVSCGPADGVIKMWDLRRCYSTLKKEPVAKHSLPYAGNSTLKGFTNLIVDDSETRLFASCMDSKIYSYNISAYSKEPTMIYSGLQINSFYIKSCLSPDGRYLLSGSSDEKAYIWNIENPHPVASLVGHNFEVTCVAWSNHQNNLDGGNMCIVTCSDDACHKVWRVGPEFLPEDERLSLRGHSELGEKYYQYEKSKQVLRRKLKDLSPRTSNAQNKQIRMTPTKAEISSLKRSFQEMCADDPEIVIEGNERKRPNIEAKGRRLFPSSPSSCIDHYSTTSASRPLETLFEELSSTQSQNFQNLVSSPVKRQINIIKSPENLRVSKSKSLNKDRMEPSVNSPTMNLPNFVIDGDAPHLSLMSPHRKTKKENVDWLTKMRKQKLLSLNNALEKATTATEIQNDQNDKLLKSIENKSESQEKKKSQKKTEATILNNAIRKKKLTCESRVMQKFEAQKQMQNFGFPTGSRIILYGGKTCVIAPEQKTNTSTPTVIGTIESPQICHLCQKEFSSIETLQNHIKEQHVDSKFYRNIIAVSTVGNQVTMIPTPLQQYQIGTSAVKIEKDFHPIHAKLIPEIIKPSNSEFANSVTNLNIAHPVIQHIQIQPREKEKANVVQVIKQNPVEYHIQQQEHAAMVVASMSQKSGVCNPFLNSTIKYELHGQPVQLVSEVYPQMLAEAPKSDDLNSQSSVSSPGSSVNVQNATGPMLSNGETMEKQHKCLVCDKFFTTVGNLNIHLKIHAGEKPYKCTVCGKGFIQSNNLATHMKIHTGEKPHGCQICGKRFSQSNNLKTHIRTHTGEKPFKCTLCEKSFNQKNNLTTHLRTHSDYHPSNCSMCNQTFMSFNELFSHMRDHAEEKPHVCSVCNKVFSVQNDLNDHMKQHSNPKPYKCDICQKQFTQSNNLKTHIKTHIYQDPFKCSMCTRSFQDQEEYQLHMRVHTFDKPYECTYCGKKFIQSNNLKTHVRTHTGEKPYACTVCGKSFNQKNNLNTHLRVHTGEKPFECHLCDRRFNQSNNLNKHLKTHGQEKEISKAMETEMEKMMNNVIQQQ
ncbi:CLUMA_CG013378, isoform A [Clunio marinus]|uniref:CLUMA_CG013378, isoform A n=1 Tax=Clunio marinus TaxID=568069 RepID=A0A1J1IIS7_9DIPT|nr:CLUMA_CG013378, isoform A [Clunio marinus]